MNEAFRDQDGWKCRCRESSGTLSRLADSVVPYGRSTRAVWSTAPEGKPVRIRRWSATVNGAPNRRRMSRDTSRSGEFPPSRHKDGARCDPVMRSFPGRGPGSENRAHTRRTLMGAPPLSAGHVLASATMTSLRHRRCGVGVAVAVAPDPAVRGGTVGRHVGGRPADLERQHRGALVGHRQRHPVAGGRPCRHCRPPSRARPTWRPTSAPYVTVDGADGPASWRRSSSMRTP